jgi:hypothetical protein
MHSRRTAAGISFRLCSAISLMVVALGADTSRVWAEDGTQLFTKVGELTLSDGSPAFGPVALSPPAPVSPDIAVVGSPENGEVHVFERDSGRNDWHHTVTLRPDDAAIEFGRSVATNGVLTVVGASGAAYVFLRTRIGAPIPVASSWLQVDKLTGDEDFPSFGHSVAISGTTVVVGEPFFGLIGGRGVAHVFDLAHDGSTGWSNVATLSNPRGPVGGFGDGFGVSVAIDEDTVVVGSVNPFILSFFGSTGQAHVFSRDQGGQNAWGLVAELRLLPPGLSASDSLPAAVAISGGTIAMVAGGPTFNAGWIFERDPDGPDFWRRGARLPADDFGIGSLALSGDMAVVTNRLGAVADTYVFARHKSAAHAWGRVARISGGGSRPRHSAIGGDTLLLGNAQTGSDRWVIEVYVSDMDRDGIRDDADRCPRDPLNSPNCQRTSAAHPIVDEFLTLTDLAVLSSGDPFVIGATFTNDSQTAIANPFFEVTELTGNLILNADGGSTSIGATLSPDVGDGILLPGDSMTIEFVIQLATREPFRFLVTVRGDEPEPPPPPSAPTLTPTGSTSARR